MRLAAAVGVLALFFAGLAWWYGLRMEQGEIFPEYSSLRSDPRGARVLYEALGDMEGVEVSRSLGPGPPPGEPGDAVLVLGFPARWWDWGSGEDALELASLASGGGRVVVAFHPGSELSQKEDETGGGDEADGEEDSGGSVKPGDVEPGEDNAAGEDDTAGQGDAAGEGESGSPCPEEEEPGGFERVLRAGVLPARESVARSAVLAPGAWPPGMPRRLTLHTSLRLALEPPWQTVYEAVDGPVVAVRPFGRGSLVLLADPFWLSNEALAMERRPAFLGWVLSGARRVAFEERHLGVARDQGVMVLARKYRLEALLAGILLALVFALWRSLAPFLPLREPPPSPEEEGADAARGMETLLARRLPPARALEMALEELSRPGPLDRLPGEAKKRVEQAARDLAGEIGVKDPEEAWRRIAEQVAREAGK